MSNQPKSIQEKTINTLRYLSAEMVQKANSGHPGAPMGMAPMAYAVWLDTMRHDPAKPDWPNRDRFVLSNGHASALLYSLLHVGGYGLPMEEVQRFRQWKSLTPGHPEHGLTVGVETTTGPLGQGFANAVGFAIAESILAAKFNRPGFPVVDHRVFAFAGDGCMMEGITSEAASLAGTLALGKLTVLYDDNGISIEGDTDLAFREDVGARFLAYGWNVIRVRDAHDYTEVLDALRKTENSGRPNLIVCPTIIGYGSAAKQGTAGVHGEPLGAENLAQVKEYFGITGEPFTIDQEVYDHAAGLLQKGAQAREEWERLFAEYAKAHPDLAAEWKKWHSPLSLDDLLKDESLRPGKEKPEATRSSSGDMINKLAKIIPNLVGGSADLAPSTKTYIKDGGDFSAQNRSGRNFRFGVREHAMAAVSSGIALHGGLRVFCATFFVFTDYMKAAMRLAAIMELPVTYVLTHDSIGVGEDGATHEPIEHLTALRATPGMRVIRPCDANETADAWLTALTAHGPTCLVLTRQNLRQFTETAGRAAKGGYVLKPSQKEQPDLILMGSGSEVALLAEAQETLRAKGIDASVVSMPSMDMFLAQPKEYRDSVLPPQVRARLAAEAGATMPWHRFVGPEGAILGIDRFGASAPAETIFREYGFTAQNVAEMAERVVRG
ncbi:MAG TPA: transketolase [Candidatus Limnocylindria bacterium]|nr:transketolase [Candidatus Limnocylindria bacterium]